MNILHINTLDNTGGAAKVAYRLKDGLKKRGYTSWMLVGYKLSKSPDVKQIFWNKYLQFGLNIVSTVILRPYLIFRSTFRIKDRSDVANSDIIHLHNLHGGYFNPLAFPELTKLKPTLYTLHDMWALTGHCAHSFDCDKWQTGCGDCPYLKVYPALWYDVTHKLWDIKKDIYNRSDFIIVTPSRWLKNKIEKSILSEKKIYLIYNGIDPGIFHPMDKTEIRKKLNLPLDKTILMFSAHKGIKNFWKGGEYLLKALEQIDDENVFFLNIGSTENLDKRVKKSIEWVSIPYVDNEKTMAEYYAASDLFLYPSLADNCPLVVLESMACSTPVIAFDTGGIPELLTNMKTGYIARYKDVDDFVKGIKLFLNDVDLRAKAGLSARKDVEKHFTLDKMVTLYEELYNKLAPEH
ncbi:Trehalose synthase [uncultured archaeon]|nr:Trehalose synthase [uncultured archaeon]